MKVVKVTDGLWSFHANRMGYAVHGSIMQRAKARFSTSYEVDFMFNTYSESEYKLFFALDNQWLHLGESSLEEIMAESIDKEIRYYEEEVRMKLQEIGGQYA